MPLIERQYVEVVVPAGEHDDRRVGETDVEIGERLDHLMRRGDVAGVAGVDRLEPVGPARHVGEQRERRMRADAGCEQVVELGEDERREQERSACREAPLPPERAGVGSSPAQQ